MNHRQAGAFVDQLLQDGLSEAAIDRFLGGRPSFRSRVVVAMVTQCREEDERLAQLRVRSVEELTEVDPTIIHRLVIGGIPNLEELCCTQRNSLLAMMSEVEIEQLEAALEARKLSMEE